MVQHKRLIRFRNIRQKDYDRTPRRVEEWRNVNQAKTYHCHNLQVSASLEDNVEKSMVFVP